MFDGLKHKWRSAEAAALIESTFEHMAELGTFDGNAKTLGHRIVKGASELRPDLFDGRNGHRPHRISYAAMALALTAERAPTDGRVFPVVMIALGLVLEAARLDAVSLPFSPQDLMLLDSAATVFTKLAEEDACDVSAF